MAPQIIAAISKHYTTKSSPLTAPVAAKALAYGLVRFLDRDDRRDLSAVDFTLEHALAFDRFLAEMDVADAVRFHRWSAAATMLRRCGGRDIGPSRWRGTKGPGKGRGLDAGELRTVLAAAVSEAMQTMSRYDAQFDRRHPQWQVATDVEMLEVLFELRCHFSGKFPHVPDIEVVNRSLAHRVRSVGWNKLRRWWGPTPATIGPFLTLMLYWFRLNASMAQKLKVGQIDEIDGEWIVLKRKDRGGRRLTPGYPDGNEPLGPRVMKAFMKRWTEPVRNAGPEALRGHFFLVWNWPYASTASLESCGIMTNVFKGFRQRHGIPRLTAGLLRPSAIDVVGELTGDDLDFRVATGSHTANVNRRSYRLPDAETRDRVRIGTMLSVRRRDYLSHPAAASVGRVGSGGWQAATPGWRCEDPTNRRFSSSAPGGLCDAVGRCPACHLGRPMLECGYSLAHSLALLEAAEAEIASGRPERMGAYAPVVDRLETFWLPAFTEVARTNVPPVVPSLMGCLS